MECVGAESAVSNELVQGEEEISPLSINEHVDSLADIIFRGLSFSKGTIRKESDKNHTHFFLFAGGACTAKETREKAIKLNERLNVPVSFVCASLKGKEEIRKFDQSILSQIKKDDLATQLEFRLILEGLKFEAITRAYASQIAQYVLQIDGENRIKCGKTQRIICLAHDISAASLLRAANELSPEIKQRMDVTIRHSAPDPRFP